MTSTAGIPQKRQVHRTFAELMDMSHGTFRKGERNLLEKQAQAHRAAAEASRLPRVRAHLLELANDLDAILAAPRRRAAETENPPADDAD